MSNRPRDSRDLIGGGHLVAAVAVEAADVRAYSEAKNEIIDDIYRRAFADESGVRSGGVTSDAEGEPPAGRAEEGT